MYGSGILLTYQILRKIHIRIRILKKIPDGDGYGMIHREGFIWINSANRSVKSGPGNVHLQTGDGKPVPDAVVVTGTGTSGLFPYEPGAGVIFKKCN